METEEFVSGFCKAQNQTRRVLCEFKIRPDGEKELVSADCAFGRCPHSGSCLLMSAFDFGTAGGGFSIPKYQS